MGKMVDTMELLLVVAVVAIAAFYAWYVYSSITKKPLTGREGLVGAKGVVYSEVLTAQEGEVSIDGVIWKASLSDSSLGELKRGDEVVVKRVQDLSLIVEQKTSTETRVKDMIPSS